MAATIAVSGATKFAIRSTRIIQPARLLVGPSQLGRLADQRAPIAGRLGRVDRLGRLRLERTCALRLRRKRVLRGRFGLLRRSRSWPRRKSTRSRRKRSPPASPEVAPDQAEWMPLGVFALTPDGQASGPDPTLFLQLAISKEGIISGTLNNSATEKTQTIEGMADKNSQRCAWTVAGQTRPIMETGINNLTEDTAPALVHFADGQTQQWLMVRLEEPAPQP